MYLCIFILEYYMKTIIAKIIELIFDSNDKDMQSKH